MSARASLGLITIGAILTFAVRAQPSFLDLHVTGMILIAIGLIRPLVAGWSSLAPRLPRRVEVVDEVVEAEPPPAERVDTRGGAAGRSTPPARHAGRPASVVEPSARSRTPDSGGWWSARTG